jgi:DinB superfamily
MESCRECGFAYDVTGALAAGDTIVRSVDDLSGMLRCTAVDVRVRPEPETWSVLEYACHTRDVLLVHRERVLVARREDRPVVTSMGIEQRVEHDGYSSQLIVDVERQVIEAARLFANVLRRLGPQDWERTTVMLGSPEPSEWPLRQVAIHAEHEVRHHLMDIQRQLIRPG